MMYKTIVLELLHQHPEIVDSLRRNRQLLPTLECYSSQLKTDHETWINILFQARPGSNESQIASEALEIAIMELEDRSSSGSPPDDSEPLSLDAAMAYLRCHTPLV